MKTIIERGASWTLEETKMLLALWGQDEVQRQATNTKRTKECYEKISEKFSQNGFERTAEQVRTRVFNMIAEYRRIIKDPFPEQRMKKCIFFETLHKIYQAKNLDDVRSALDDYEPDFPYSPASNTFFSHMGDESVSDSEATDGNESIITTNNSINNITTATTTTSTTNTTNANQANSTSSASNSTHSSGNTATNNSVNDDDNNGDSNNNNNGNEKGTTSSSNSHHSVGSATKKVKLEAPHAKSGHNQTNQSVIMAAPSTSSSSNSEHVNPKHGKSTLSAAAAAASTTLQVNATTATTFASGSTTLGSSNSSSAANLAAASSSQRHQSLLLQPNATSGSSTPISKINTSGGNNTQSFLNLNSTKQIPIIRAMGSLANGNEAINLNGTNRLATTAAITSHQLYQAPVNTFDVTSSALLIDRMFAHLSRESENMREWIALEKERLALERARRQQETEREVRRERVLIDTLMRFQEQWLSFLSRLDPRLIENADGNPPELRIPPNKETSSADASQSTQGTTTTTASTSVSATASLNNNNNSTSPTTETSK